jgi:CubicO group peptidase (beta-lactamase class C family)
LESCIEEEKFPAAVSIVSEKGRILFRFSKGLAVLQPERIPVAPHTIFDAASLTKPLVTSFLLLLLAQEGVISLGDSISRYVEGFSRPDKDRIRILDCMSHRAGFRAWMPLYLFGDSLEGYVRKIAEEPLRYPICTGAEYSCLGYIVLGAVIRAVSGKSVGDLAREKLFDRLGLANTYFPLPASLRRRTAATEKGNACEKEMAKEFLGDLSEWPWNDEILWGVVHDGNARILGKNAGNSGLFITAEDVHTLAGEFLPSATGLLSDKYKHLAMRNHSSFETIHFSAGWELNSSRLTSAGTALPREAFGHTGFTGVSLWIDPLRERIYILLTNRVHPKSKDVPMNEIRRAFHSLAAPL